LPLHLTSITGVLNLVRRSLNSQYRGRDTLNNRLNRFPCCCAKSGSGTVRIFGQGSRTPADAPEVRKILFEEIDVEKRALQQNPDGTYSNEIDRAVEALPALPPGAGDLVRTSMIDELDLASIEAIIAENAQAAESYAAWQQTASSWSRFRAANHPVGHALLRAAVLALSPLVLTKESRWISPPHLAKHCIASALWCEAILARQGRASAPWACVSAFLHDTGIAVLNNVAHADFEPCLAAASKMSLTLSDAERQFIDPNHAQITARLCTTWMLPFRISELVLHHHEGQSDFAHELAALRVADLLADRECARPIRLAEPEPALVHERTLLALDSSQLAELCDLREVINEESDYLYSLFAKMQQVGPAAA
jgi:HD-like signal output (HDOD) protein